MEFGQLLLIQCSVKIPGCNKSASRINTLAGRTRRLGDNMLVFSSALEAEGDGFAHDNVGPANWKIATFTCFEFFSTPAHIHLKP